ncbi:hypothetical protein B0H19DRAFT_1063279 [Mycena capillaripes]|nr:hypothetical protein B0H19DRAFT_1063279 [Mycena capillaripes]
MQSACEWCSQLSGLPKFLWARGYCHSVWVWNRLLMRPLPAVKTQHKMGTGEKPNLANILEWDANDKTAQGHFVEYNNETKDGYCIHWPTKQKVTVERDIYFNKDEILESESTPIEGGEKSANLVNPPALQSPVVLEPLKRDPVGAGIR